MKSNPLSELRSKPKEFITPDSYQIGTEISMLRRAAIDLIDVVHKLTAMQQLHISKVRGQMAVRMVSRAVRVILAYKDQTKNRNLADPEKQKIIRLVEDVLNGKRQAVQFQSTLDGSGLLELFSNEVIQSEDDQILNLKHTG